MGIILKVRLMGVYMQSKFIFIIILKNNTTISKKKMYTVEGLDDPKASKSSSRSFSDRSNRTRFESQQSP